MVLDWYWWYFLLKLKKKILAFFKDGATPHRTNSNMDFLQHIFGNNIFSSYADRRGAHDWAAGSPDLSICDFWLWSKLKVLNNENLEFKT